MAKSIALEPQIRASDANVNWGNIRHLDRCYAWLGTACATIACDISEAEVGFAPFDAGFVHGFLESALGQELLFYLIKK